VILSPIASLLQTTKQCKVKKVEIRVALPHVPRYPTDYVTRLEQRATRSGGVFVSLIFDYSVIAWIVGSVPLSP